MCSFDTSKFKCWVMLETSTSHLKTNYTLSVARAPDKSTGGALIIIYNNNNNNNNNNTNNNNNNNYNNNYNNIIILYYIRLSL